MASGEGRTECTSSFTGPGTWCFSFFNFFEDDSFRNFNFLIRTLLWLNLLCAVVCCHFHERTKHPRDCAWSWNSIQWRFRKRASSAAKRVHLKDRSVRSTAAAFHSLRWTSCNYFRKAHERSCRAKSKSESNQHQQQKQQQQSQKQQQQQSEEIRVRRLRASTAAAAVIADEEKPKRSIRGAVGYWRTHPLCNTAEATAEVSRGASRSSHAGERAPKRAHNTKPSPAFLLLLLMLLFLLPLLLLLHLVPSINSARRQ